uniref:Mediator of RNA polymerase II transcription subunit 9 n=1 Tax=Culex pipiens TaxID=7175 RepID=A0A8D8C715_CULPI
MEPMQLEQLEVKPQIVSQVPSGGGVDSNNPSSVTGAGAVASNACSDLQQETKKQEQKQKVAEIEILPVIYEIIRSVEKDPVDNAAKQKESADCSQKVLELQKTLEAARATIRQLPGIEFSKEEQLRRLESLRKQLALKQQLIKKYKNVQF